MTPEAGTSREELFAELDAATKAADVAEQLESDARRVNISARNRLSDAQKAVDAYMLGLRGNAPWDSPWRLRPSQPAGE